MQRNSVRIIAGQWRRKTLSFPDQDGLRPTADRVRETLFNWLGQDLPGLQCLDLFAGSGALAFEAASRRAAHVIAIERNPVAYRNLLSSKAQLSASTVEIIQADALLWLARSTAQFDVIFADPPFAADLLGEVLRLALPRLTPEGLLYIEGERLPTLPHTAAIHREGKAGKVRFALIKQASSPD